MQKIREWLFDDDYEYARIFTMFFLLALFAIFVIFFLVKKTDEVDISPTTACAEDMIPIGNWEFSYDGLRIKTKCGYVLKGAKREAFFTYVGAR